MKITNWIDIKNKILDKEANKITDEDFKNWVNENIEPDLFIGITRQYSIAQTFTNKFEADIFDYQTDLSKTDSAIIYLTYDINLIYFVLFSICDISISNTEKTTVNYDLIMRSGFYDILFEKIGNYFLKIKEKCDKMTGINELPTILAIERTYYKPLTPDDADKIKNIINEIDTDKLKIIENIQNYNSPAVSAISKILSKETAVDYVKKIGETNDKDNVIIKKQRRGRPKKNKG